MCQVVVWVEPAAAALLVMKGTVVAAGVEDTQVPQFSDSAATQWALPAPTACKDP